MSTYDCVVDLVNTIRQQHETMALTDLALLDEPLDQGGKIIHNSPAAGKRGTRNLLPTTPPALPLSA